MELVRLADDNYNVIRYKKICCVEKNAAYFNELFSKYDLKNSITFIVDADARNHGDFLYQDKSFRVTNMEHLHDVNYDDSVIIITSDYYREYFDTISELLCGDDKSGQIYFFPNKETEYELYYRDQYKNTPLQDILVFRSGPHASAYVKGMDFADNARALFEYALSIKLNEKYELVWFVKEPDEFKEFGKYKNVSFLPFDGSVSDDKAVRDSYYRKLCLAKYFFFTDAYGFVRNCRSDQIRIQLWHGCGFKKRLSIVPCNKRYEYMTVTSDLYAELHAKEFGLQEKQMLVAGCAKEDWLFERDNRIWKLIGIPKGGKYIFWLPTYRFSDSVYKKPVDGFLNLETGLPLFTSKDKLNEVNEQLKEQNVILILKLHPFQDSRVIDLKAYSNIVLLDNGLLVEMDIQINQLLGFADALISDYSSTAVDYLVLNKPMAFIVDDLDDYENRRGFIFEDIENWLPGSLISSVTEITEFVSETSHGIDTSYDKRQRILQKFHKNADNHNCMRIFNALGIE